MIITSIPQSKKSLAFANCGFLSSHNFKNFKSTNEYAYIKVQVDRKCFAITTKLDKCVNKGELQLSGVFRSWMGINEGDSVTVEKLEINISELAAIGISFIIEPFKQDSVKRSVDCTRLSTYLNETMCSHIISSNQIFLVELKRNLYKITVEKISLVSDQKQMQQMGFTSVNTTYHFKSNNSNLILSGADNLPSIFTTGWDFSKLGVGGLSDEFQYLFRRAFVSRMCPPELIAQIGEIHCRGILLYGPPGTGKTLLAREICKMLHTHEPKIVNGPEILNKYVGESESNIRKLFEDAEVDEKKFGIKSPLHIIIFDEIDAICKKRGTVGGGSGVYDSVINQLLSKLDGVEQLNNILVIGMTNRKDMIDEALLRPGRLGVHIQIGLPSESGRVEILKIHTEKIKKSGRLNKDVDLNVIAKKCKNFSGAECEALVRAATTRALNSLVNVGKRIKLKPNAHKSILVKQQHLLEAAKEDIQPSFGTEITKINHYCRNGIIMCNENMESAIEESLSFIKEAANVDYSNRLVSILFEGAPGAGKTAIAAHLAKLSNFPFIKIISSKNLIGFSDLMKCNRINQIFEDAYKSPLSCIILDCIESLIDFVAIGPRFSNSVLQTILTLLKHHPPGNDRLVILATTSRKDVLMQLNIDINFSHIVHIPIITTPTDVVTVLNSFGHFETLLDKQIITKLLVEYQDKILLGIKRLIAAIDLSLMTQHFNENIEKEIVDNICEMHLDY
ncbi:hypothetical protein A3Q56_05765 [Intoshia linei]|uniref:Vesicle-fusing ATPase n=1 Tax=Intoshia linei TaxID=1819745 RepID=A0A177AXD2_9BILA|nr:hypothetical protein A3Q56_05765 [Intoshia linei]